MRLYHHLTCGVFVKRLNRFSALCDIGNTIHTVHVKNTGRLGELLIPAQKYGWNNRTIPCGRPPLTWWQWKRPSGA